MSSPPYDGFPWPRQTPGKLPEAYRCLREQSPVAKAFFPSGQPVWLVSNYELVREVLISPHISSEHSHPAFPSVFPVRQKRSENGMRPKLAYSGMDGPEHAFHRRMVASEFSRTAIERHRSSIEIVARQQVDDYASHGTPGDLVAGFAKPLVERNIGSFLGLSAKETAECARFTNVVLGSGDDSGAVDQASRHLQLVVSQVLKDRVASPSNDLIGRLVKRYLDAGIYEHDQLIRLVKSLITAGLETTANMISLSVMTLLKHLEQLALLRSDRLLLPNAVNELQRYLSIADIVTARVATADIQIGGHRIPEGAGVVALTASANRDPIAFCDPDTLDIRRSAGHHLSFGYGSHNCLGQHLANVILECAFSALLDRFESIRMAPSDPENGRMSTGVITGIDRLLLDWDPA